MNKDLTERESEVMGHLLQGSSVREIAKQLDISIGTVKFHLTKVYRKHGVRSGRELMSQYVSQQTHHDKVQ